MTDDKDRPPFDPERLEQLHDHVIALEGARQATHARREQILKEIQALSVDLGNRELYPDDPMRPQLQARIASLKAKHQSLASHGPELGESRELLDRCAKWARTKHRYRLGQGFQVGAAE